jgi:hypothetical protein
MIDPNEIYDFDFENIDDLENYEHPLSFESANETNQFNEQFDDNDDYIYQNEPLNYDDVTDSLSDIDFSDIRGDFKQGMRKIAKKVDQKKTIRGKAVSKKNVPLMKKKIVRGGVVKEVFVKKRAVVHGNKPFNKIIVPRDRSVIVEGVSRFMLDDSAKAQATKNIGYYKGKKLQELVFTFNNTGALPFNLQIFDPSMPLDYLYSTGLNINNKIEVAGTNPTQYTDVLNNILANPTLIPNAKFVVSGPLLQDQVNQSLLFTNKNIEGKAKLIPYNIFLQKDTQQFQNQVIYFDISGGLNRPFIPDGMDTLTYTILPGMVVTFGFYYKQISLKKFFYKEARDSKALL